jgi:hypothetical protein
MPKPYTPATVTLLAAGFVHGKGPSVGIRYYTPDGLVAIIVYPECFEAHIGLLNVETQEWQFPFAGRVSSEAHFLWCIAEYVPLTLLPTKCKERFVRMGIF